MEIKEVKKIIMKENGKTYSLNYLKPRFPEVLKWIDKNIKGETIKEKIVLISLDLKEPPKCKECDNYVKYKGTINKWYRTYCSFKCRSNSKEVIEKKRKTNLERYGAENNWSSKSSVRHKIYDTCYEKFGVKTPIQNKNIRDKYENTMMKRYGAKCNLSTENTKRKIEETNLKRYGVKRPAQNPDIMIQIMNSRTIRTKKYKDTNLHYQGQLELLFLEKMEEIGKINELENGKTFRYSINKKAHLYFSDFFWKKRNLIIEIKSKWTFDNRGTNDNLKFRNETKRKSVLLDGNHDFIFLIEKEEILKFIYE